KKFEKLFGKKFLADLEIIIASLLRSADLKKIDIDEVVVVGGSSRVPLIQNFLRQYFGNKDLNKTVNADESVATGAAILANELVKDKEHRTLAVQEMIQKP
ncbi:Heat shock protein 70 family, partial [Trinorchestia longiramus]